MQLQEPGNPVAGSADNVSMPRLRGDNITGPLAREHALVEKSRREAQASAQVG